jgi:phospholipid-binding lipoprotein MlaA
MAWVGVIEVESKSGTHCQSPIAEYSVPSAKRRVNDPMPEISVPVLTRRSAPGSRAGWSRGWSGLLLVALLLCPVLGGADETALQDSGDSVAETLEWPEPEPEIANPDPWEKMNRGIFGFNEVADAYVLEPVARFWGFITPHFFHKAVRNFNGLILMPTVLFNDILQLKGEHAMQDIGRILVNATIGLVGLIDVATPMGIPENDAGFGQTLGYWGAPPGPYLVLPLFGPSSIRGGIGRVGDGAGTFYFTWLPIWATFIVRGVDIISWRSDHVEDIDLTRRESLDYYVFMRDAYTQISQARVDEARGVVVASPASDAELYFYDEDFDDGFSDEEDGDENAKIGSDDD